MMKLAIVLLIALTGLCSACGPKQTAHEPLAIVPIVECPAPQPPALPVLQGGLPFDHPSNIAAMMERDDALRMYIKGLEATCKCYQSQIKENQYEHE